MRLLRSAVAAVLGFAIYFAVYADTVTVTASTTKDPLSYPLKQYGFVLAMAIFGGLVSWYAKVRDGKAAAWNIMQLIGELTTSAFAGLLTFWGCELLNSPALLTPALVGIAGHMGTRAISAFEDAVRKRFGDVTGTSVTTTTTSSVTVDTPPVGKG
jgi:hypothetical protein